MFSLIRAQFGYDSFYLGRIDYQDKSNRLLRRNMEMLWNVSNAADSTGTIFTGVNFNLYQPPDGFDWELGHNDPPIMDDPLLDGYNVDQRVSAFIETARNQVMYCAVLCCALLYVHIFKLQVGPIVGLVQHSSYLIA